jgi:hypothetical protein
VVLDTPAPRRIRNASMIRVLCVSTTSVSASAPAARSMRCQTGIEPTTPTFAWFATLTPSSPPVVSRDRAEVLHARDDRRAGGDDVQLRCASREARRVRR